MVNAEKVKGFQSKFSAIHNIGILKISKLKQNAGYLYMYIKTLPGVGVE